MIDEKYDVVISYADEDKDIIRELTLGFRTHKLKYFDFYENVNAGKRLIKVTLDTYGDNTWCVLAVISKHYVGKYWPATELEVAQLAADEKKLILIALFLDDTRIDKLPGNILHLKWKNNPGEVAVHIANAIRPAKDAARREAAETAEKEAKEAAERAAKEVAQKKAAKRKLILRLSIIIAFGVSIGVWVWLAGTAKKTGNTQLVDNDSVSRVKTSPADTHSIPPLNNIKPDKNKPKDSTGTKKQSAKVGDYTITGIVTNEAGKPLDSVAVSVQAQKAFSKNGYFQIILPGIVKMDASYELTIDVFFEKDGYKPLPLKETFPVDIEHTSRNVQATLIKQN